MKDYIELGGNDCRFVADTHFYDAAIPGERDRRGRFIRFLDSLEADTVLFLLGDIFDFYFEYRSVVPRRFADLYRAIQRCRDRGVAMHFIGGNHDYWVGSFFTEDLGIEVHEAEILIETQGRRAVLAHGDLVLPGDTGYKILKSIIRNRAVIGAARWLHPDIMDRIAKLVATTSRKYKAGSQDERARRVLEHAFDYYFDRGNDIFVMGHIHAVIHERRDGHEFMLLGDWIQHFTYGRLTDGKLTMEVFEKGGS